MSDLDLARLFKVSVPTIRRWKAGVSTPHPIMFKGIMLALCNSWKQLSENALR